MAPKTGRDTETASGAKAGRATGTATDPETCITAGTASVAVSAGDKMLLVVVFGGESPEHEVSCVSAQAVLANADPLKPQK